MEVFLRTVGALNDETRLRILRFIHENGTVCVCDATGMTTKRRSKGKQDINFTGGTLSPTRAFAR